ncbi:Heme/hemopexin transporter protein huxB precursor [Serratia proteamaculans]|jgi:hemolysin activation/secretion protein|nr:Heme/hemopexin transporter protein huxB precursor [Serratia proteamaculans]CAI1064958.1 Heme/hemopexin transporter protein huxB precursor [Serratia proteamaculans]CAI1884822.1 Heme/hemopexin transporter protein huxB precursor [Serratia proteamaculans]
MYNHKKNLNKENNLITGNVITFLNRHCHLLASHGAILFFLFSPQSLAALPNAGQAIRDLENTRPNLPAPVKIETPSPTAPPISAESDNSPRLQITGFVITGNQSIPSAKILSLLSDLNGRSLTLTQLKEAAQRVTAYYRQQGYVLTTAYLPKQEIVNGQVRIDVLEGRYGQIHLNNGSHVRDSVLRQPLSAIQNGMPVTGDRLERSLLLLNDTPGVKISSTLRPGELPGTTDWQIDAAPGPWVNGSLQADNYGDTYTGEYRGGGALSVNSPLRLGDKLDLRLLNSDKHQRYYRVAYQLPVGPWSTRPGVAHSYMNYRLGKDFSELQAHGNAAINSIFVSQSLLRSRTLNVNAQLQFDDKTLRDDIDLFESRSRKRIALWTAEINLNTQDLWYGGGQNAATLAYGIGRLRIDDPYARQWDRRTASTEGQFSKLTLSALRLQNLNDAFQLYGQLNAQWAPGNLDSSEKFNVGGPYGVRADAPGSGNGDLGWQASLELRYALGPGWQLSAFTDQGQARLNRQPWTKEKNTVHMSAAGSALAWGGTNHQVSLTAAWPLAHSGPGSSTEKSPRIWLQAARYF